MKVLKKEPGGFFQIVDIDNTLQALQRAVDGHIEFHQLDRQTGIICNEEGRLNGLPSQNVLGCRWYGTVLLVGTEGEEFTDVSDTWIELMHGRFPDEG